MKFIPSVIIENLNISPEICVEWVKEAFMSNCQIAGIRGMK